MDIALDAAVYVLATVMTGVAATWVWLIRAMLRSFWETPRLDAFRAERGGLKVSVILPARNEEDYIGRCLDSLLVQDYGNYEIMAVDDSSDDATWKIIREYAARNPRVVPVSARPKPDDWVGKSWACCEGYRQASGDLLLFTDSDTVHSGSMISLAASHLVSADLDALTVIPRMLCFDFWTRITMPMLTTFLHTRFSALKVNEPTSKVGYFFGSFFIMRRKVYEEVGTHQSVRHEIVEDGALGEKVKRSGYRLRMVRGENLISAVWARDAQTLWDALKRLMVPVYLRSRTAAAGILAATSLLLVAPFPLLAYSAASATPLSAFLFWPSLAASALVYAASFTEARHLKIGTANGALAPLGCFVVVLGFLSSLVNASSCSSVSWRGRDYAMKDHARSSLRA